MKNNHGIRARAVTIAQQPSHIHVPILLPFFFYFKIFGVHSQCTCVELKYDFDSNFERV
jgi:hypothetical protein